MYTLTLNKSLYIKLNILSSTFAKLVIFFLLLKYVLQIIAKNVNI